MMKKKVRTIYDWRKNIMNKKLARIITSFSCACILLSGNVYAEETKIDKPVIEYNEAKQKNIAVYDSIYMGSYPQSEVVSKDAVYEQLVTSQQWNDDVLEISGVKYCRKKPEQNDYGWKFLHSDTYTNSFDMDSFDWGEAGWYNLDNKDLEYHYFKYEPVQWRVLSVDNNVAMVMSDKILDSMIYYNTDYIFGLIDFDENASAWGDSVVRNFLNKDFIKEAFTDDEIKSIVTTDNSGTTGNDKIYLLTQQYLKDELLEKLPPMDYPTYRSPVVCARPSDYAWAMGCPKGNGKDSLSLGNSHWWLILDGEKIGTQTTGPIICSNGKLYGTELSSSYTGVRPVMCVDLTSDAYSYAGKISTDIQLCGDLDKDDNVSLSDALKALKYSLGIETSSDETVKICDTDNDKTITLQDVMEILKIATGISNNKLVEN